MVVIFILKASIQTLWDSQDSDSDHIAVSILKFSNFYKMFNARLMFLNCLLGKMSHEYL